MASSCICTCFRFLPKLRLKAPQHLVLLLEQDIHQCAHEGTSPRFRDPQLCFMKCTADWPLCCQTCWHCMLCCSAYLTRGPAHQLTRAEGRKLSSSRAWVSKGWSPTSSAPPRRQMLQTCINSSSSTAPSPDPPPLLGNANLAPASALPAPFPSPAALMSVEPMCKLKASPCSPMEASSSRKAARQVMPQRHALGTGAQ